jgi:hypothetical protein
VQQTFTNYRSEAIAALSPKFGSKAATQLVDSVIDGSREKMVGCVKTLRISLVRRGLLHEPCRNTMAVARYYACEFAIRFSPGTLAAVCILSSNNGDTTTIIEGLLPILQSSAKLIETRPLMQQPPSGSQAKGMTAVADLRAKTTGSALALLANIARWLLAEWLSPFRDKKNVTLQISQSYYYDLLLGSRRHSYGTSSWLAQLAKMLLPPADLWILLGADGTGSQSGDPEVLSKETVRQLEAYRSFVKTKKRYVILDLRKPAADVVEEAYAAIIDILAQRADGKLRNRF